jgi:hypothetical protein
MIWGVFASADSVYRLAIVPHVRKPVAVLVGAACFGLSMAAIKGSGAGARDALGNISAPWLLLSFVAGVSVVRVRVAALVGLGAALTALAAFYVAESVLLDLGAHSWIADLSLTVRAGRFYFVGALISGPVFGALGGLWARRRSTILATCLALLFVLEPLTLWAYHRRIGGHVGAGELTSYSWMWVGEVMTGLTAATAIVVPALGRGRRGPGQRGWRGRRGV